MIKNYLLIAFRNLSKNKGFSFINIFGLAIGMAACLLLLQYVTFELSFDKFHTKGDRIYRINQDRYDNGKLSTRWAGGAFAPGSEFKTQLPDIEDFVKMVPAGQVLVNYKNQKIVIKDQYDYFVSGSFFNIFSYPLLSGDPKTALQEPNTVVISETLANKLFHNTNPVGQTLVMNNDKPIKITGVMKDMPANTHMKLDFLQSYTTLVKNYAPDIDNRWYNDGCTTYVLLRPGVDPRKLEAKFLPIVKKAYEPMKNATAIYTLQPVQSIHLYSNRMFELQPNSDGNSVYLLLGVAIFVIIIAWINYINLATARGIGRAKEVGVRKTLGSDKSQLIMQFMFEAGLLNLLSIVLAFILIAIFLPMFGSISGVNISFSLFGHLSFWLSVIGMLLVGTFFSGFYPAIVLSSFRPVEVMKGKLSASPRGIVLRKGMVVFQFAASIFLLVGSLTVFKQIEYMQKQNLGINIDQTLVIKAPLAKVDSFYRTMQNFKDESLKLANVKSITASTAVPGEPIGWNAGGIKLVGADQSTAKQYRVVGADFDYLGAFNFKLLAGRKISKDFPTDTGSVVLSKKAAEQLGYDKPADAINKRMDFWGKVYNVVGVVDNYHQQSLRDAYDAIIFRCIPDVRGDVSVKIGTADVQQTVESLRANWKKFFPEDQFDYFFLDTHFNEQYHADKQFGQVFAVFTGIGILVACLGLFGLVSYTIVQRTKEIGIRKVLGATVNNILKLLYQDFAVLIVIAFIVSIPLAWYAIHKWLQTYAFRIDINVLFFIIPFLTVIVIAFTAVSYLSVKAALMNPVKSLKTE